jgi:hypothetical protein
VGHEIPTALLPNPLTVTLGAPAAALGLIEGTADELAGTARLAGGAIADDPRRRRAQAVAGYTTTSWAFSQRAKASGLVPSMGGVGACFDNAMIESFWSRMQVELLDRQLADPPRASQRDL